MILYLLIVFLLLPLNNAEVEIEKRDSVADDEVKFMNNRYIITSEESNRAKEIIDYNRMTTYTIEVLVMLDFSIYRWWMNLYGGDSVKTISALHTFYANIFKKIKALYNQVVIRGLRYDLEVVDIKIAKSVSEVPFVENKYKISENEVNIDTVLRNLTTWLKNERKRFPRHDIFAFFTKYETGICHGLAWPMAACKDRAVSVSRELGFYDTFHVASHEIGHILGAHHDAGINCTYKDQYIMAAGYEFFTDKSFPNRYRFSRCSLEYFEKYIQKLNDVSANCLVIKSAKKYFEMDQFTKIPLGTHFTIDRHCQIFQGPNSFFCAGGGDDFKTMCREITCWNDTEKICQRTRKSAPSDGTPCESGKSCKNEACLPDPNVRSGQENCLYGDWKGMVSDNNGKDVTCNDVKRDRTYLCYMPEVANACCETCSKIYQPQEHGCEYGDKIYGCKKSECTYDEDLCCKTCKANASDPCQFGDKAPWCSSLKRFQCYTNEHTCCKTCRNWLDNTKKNCRYGDEDPICENEIKEGRPLDCARFKKICCHTCSNYN